MELHVSRETARKLAELATASGRAPEDIVEDALAGYLQEAADARAMIERRYDDLKDGRVAAVDGEQAFAELKAKSQRRRAGG